MGKPILLFVTTEDWAFLSHRLALAKAAMKEGFQVHIATRTSDQHQRLIDAGIVVHPVLWKRGGLNPLTEAPALFALNCVFRKLRPQIIHLVGMKPIIYGALCQLAAPPAYVVSAVAGLGSMFMHDTAKMNLLRQMAMRMLTLLRRQRGILLFQNRDDEALFKDKNLLPSDGTALVPGAGVDPDQFAPASEPKTPPVVASLVARLVKIKGIDDIVAAARILKLRGVPVRIRLIGAPDRENPNTVSEASLKRWHGEGIIEWMGARDDIAAVWAESHIGVLPSHGGEGLPRSLLEAGSCGKALVTTNTAGCNVLVQDGVNGLIVPPKDSLALADALERIVRDTPLRKRMGKQARAMILEEFSDQVVISAVLELYRAGLKKAGHDQLPR